MGGQGRPRTTRSRQPDLLERHRQRRCARQEDGWPTDPGTSDSDGDGIEDGDENFLHESLKPRPELSLGWPWWPCSGSVASSWVVGNLDLTHQAMFGQKSDLGGTRRG